MKKILYILVAFFVFFSLPVLSANQVLTNKDAEVFKQSLRLADKGKWDLAHRESQKSKNPIVAKIILWLDLERPGPGRSFRDYQNFLDANPHWPKQATLFAQAERSIPPDLKGIEILNWFGTREPVTIDGANALIRARSAIGEDATGLVRESWVNKNLPQNLEMAFFQQWAASLRPEDHRARADRLLWEGNLEAAARMEPRLGAPMRALLKTRIALQNQQKRGLALYTSLSPELKNDPGVVTDLARYYRKTEQIDKVLKVLNPPPSDPADPGLLWRELEYAAQGALDQNNFKLAYRLAQGHGAKNGIIFAEGEFLAGWIAYRYLRDPTTALRHFTALYNGTNSSLSRSRGAYWAYLAASRAGDKKIADRYLTLALQYPLAFFGQLALTENNSQLSIPSPPSPAPADNAAFSKDELVTVTRALHQVGRVSTAKPFLAKLVEGAKNGGQISLIAKLAHNVGGNAAMLYVMKEARKYGHEIGELLFPVMPLPRPLAIDPSLVLSILRQESAFDPLAASPAGAMGYMQLLPSTAKGVARKLKVSYSPARLTRDPNFNILLGQHYLASLIAEFNGSLVLGIAAYNAGPGRVRQWIAKYGNPANGELTALDWIERIPYSETRNYVQRVLENLQVYRARLGNGTVKLALKQDLMWNEIADAAQ